MSPSPFQSSAPFTFDSSRAKTVAADWSRKIHDARRKGATTEGLKLMESDRLKAVSDTIMSDAGKLVAEHQRRMAAVESKRPDVRVPVTSAELSARQFQLERLRDRARLMSDDALRENLAREMDDPLAADRDRVAILGTEAHHRGKEMREHTALAGNFLSHQAYEHDPEWQESNSIVGKLGYWHDLATGQHGGFGDGMLLPDGSGTIEGIISNAEKETAPAPEMPRMRGTIGDAAWSNEIAAGSGE